MKTCLVVDDSSVIRKVARRILEGLDFQIQEAEDGEQHGNDHLAARTISEHPCSRDHFTNDRARLALKGFANDEDDRPGRHMSFCSRNQATRSAAASVAGFP